MHMLWHKQSLKSILFKLQKNNQSRLRKIDYIEILNFIKF